MNVLIIDSERLDLEAVKAIYDKAVEISGLSDWTVWPMGDVDLCWLEKIRNEADEMHQELEQKMSVWKEMTKVGESINC
jgi:hypothetical protein